MNVLHNIAKLFKLGEFWLTHDLCCYFHIAQNFSKVNNFHQAIPKFPKNLLFNQVQPFCEIPQNLLQKQFTLEYRVRGPFQFQGTFRAAAYIPGSCDPVARSRVSGDPCTILIAFGLTGKKTRFKNNRRASPSDAVEPAIWRRCMHRFFRLSAHLSVSRFSNSVLQLRPDV